VIFRDANLARFSFVVLYQSQSCVILSQVAELWHRSSGGSHGRLYGVGWFDDR
jgi:hypothetical protein